MGQEQDIHEQDLGMSSRIGPFEIDWPRTVGYYGGVALALSFELIEPLLALFIAAIPLLKMLNRPGASQVSRFVGQLLEGAAKPVGGSSEATLQLAGSQPRTRHRSTMLTEARQLAVSFKGQQ